MEFKLFCCLVVSQLELCISAAHFLSQVCRNLEWGFRGVCEYLLGFLVSGFKESPGFPVLEALWLCTLPSSEPDQLSDAGILLSQLMLSFRLMFEREFEKQNFSLVLFEIRC